MRFFKRSSLLAALVLIAVLVLCPLAFAKASVLKIATTTSTDDTGILAYLAPIFLKDTGIETQWVSAGISKALEYGRNGDVDVVLTHDPSAENKFMAEGAGVNRHAVMRNDFVLIGPRSDPAGIAGKPIIEAIKMIVAKKQIFVSCADKSWTHSTELKLLAEAGVGDPDKNAWYVQTRQGVLQAVSIATERNGYTLIGRDAYIKYRSSQKDNPPMMIVAMGDKQLLNVYSVMAVNPKKHSHVQYDLAMKYINWLTSAKVQKDIANFKFEGEQLFFPFAGK